MKIVLFDKENPQVNKWFNVWQPQEDIIYDRSGECTEDDIAVFTDAFIPDPVVLSVKAKRKAAVFIEPRCVKPYLYEFVESNPSVLDRFDVVLTHDDRILERFTNARLMPLLGGSFILKEDHDIYEKHKDISIVASEKRYAFGHALRHEIINAFPQLDAYGPDYVNLYKDYEAVEPKSLRDTYNKVTGNLLRAFRDYRYSVVVENMQHDRYFTEKIINCFVTGTIPIYWGARKIGDFFDERGILVIEPTANSIEGALAQATKELYKKCQPYIKENFERAQNYLSLDRKIKEGIML